MKKRDEIIIWLFTILYIGIVLLRPIGILFVSGESMMSTIHNRQTLIALKAFYVSRGDVVAVKFEDHSVIKRIIGLPGETIECKNGVIYINDSELTENYIDTKRNTIYTDWDAVELGDDEYFIMGDNRDNSYDSRFYGAIRKNQIKYVALFVKGA